MTPTAGHIAAGLVALAGAGVLAGWVNASRSAVPAVSVPPVVVRSGPLPRGTGLASLPAETGSVAFTVDPELGNSELASVAMDAWKALQPLAPSPPPAEPIRIQRGRQLASNEAARSHPGTIELRAPAIGTSLDERTATALRHEVAHQFLWAACPAASDDALFHESFALSTSGELPRWTDDGYMGVTAARLVLIRTQNFDSRESRRAMARLLANAPTGENGIPRPLLAKLSRCDSSGRWWPLTVDELADGAAESAADAQVAISRHSGEVLFSEGGATRPMPFGSTLKPFLVAGSARPPILKADPGRPEWMCGDSVPEKMDARTAVLKSCNGYFLDWGSRDAKMAGFGSWGPVLLDLGMPRLPATASEAIGIRPTLTLSPWALGQAYRLLAESRPDLIGWMSENAEHGTLAGLAGSEEIRGVATKTGTLRDTESRPLLGWIVAVDDDVVLVTARAGRAPRTFLEDVHAGLARAHGFAGIRSAEVQTFGLVEEDTVSARCEGHGWIASSQGPQPVAEAGSTIGKLVEGGPALCLGGTWRVHVGGAPDPDREYAGIFRRSPLPAVPDASGVGVTARTVRARRGSEVVFRTTLGRYVAGVLDAEDGAIRGQARVALARVIAHNAQAGSLRHPGRAVCDTTHCTLFRGTRTVDRAVSEALRAAPLPWAGWLPYSQGGDEPWTERRSAAEVGSALGAVPRGLSFADGQVHFRRSEGDGEAIWDERASTPCEPFRNALHLPSCPSAASVVHGLLLFEGHGRGHGLGLSIESAKASPLGAEEILRQAYGAPGRVAEAP